MARLFADGFDHYGSDESNMLDGVYATVNTLVVNLSSAQAATGTHSLYFNGEADISPVALRKVLSASTDKMGVTCRLYFPDLPEDTAAMPFGFMTGDPALCQIGCFVDANGRLKFYRGTQYGGLNPDLGTLIATTDPILTAAAWHHVEVQVYIHDSAGWVRVAVNGVHKYQATGLDTAHNADTIVSFGSSIMWDTVGAGGADYYMDDLILYNFTGNSAVDTDFVPTTDGSGVATGYIGELQVMWLYPNADTAEDDWVPSTGTDAYAMVDEVDPNDADYISATATNDLTELALSDLPAEITYVRGLDLWGRMSKSDAGAATTKLGMKSVAATEDSGEIAITVAATYWIEPIDLDPNVTDNWTRPTLNAAWLRLTRSA